MKADNSLCRNFTRAAVIIPLANIVLTFRFGYANHAIRATTVGFRDRFRGLSIAESDFPIFVRVRPAKAVRRGMRQG